MTSRIILETPPHFNFRTAVYSHGWCQLRPFELDAENWRLTYVFAVPEPVTAVLSETAGGVAIELGADVSAAAGAAILPAARHVLRIDDELADFYRLTDRHKRLRWVAKLGGGRLLRSPTVFEDLVKTLCTTNCSWALTVNMVTNLVEKLGAPAADGRRAFPTAAAMAAVGEDFYRTEIRAGYRSPYFAALAARVAAGALDPEAWLRSPLPTAALKKEMKSVLGVGDYAAENLLKLVGRYDGLALDSWLRAQFSRRHRAGAPCDDKEIAAFYEKFGPWRGLAIWCDMTEKWH